MSSLPQTIQDAVTVTRKLGLQYLWVDSMCIIQDSDDDKAHEIGRMSQIYGSAYVTISASSSAKCTTGFLNRGNPNVIDIPVCIDSGTTVPAIMLVKKPGATIEHPLEPEPINKRAWTFQESFMSRRTLIFSQQQIFWACGCHWGKDGGPVSREDYFMVSGGQVRGGAVEVSRFTNAVPSLAKWKKIIEIYSLKELGDPQDKLPALSCIASFFAEKMKDQYLAGLWSKNFGELLCWYMLPFPPVKRPNTWRSPSWSFLSVDGRVMFPRTKFHESAIVSCHVTPVSTQAPFGRISSASLVIRGILVPYSDGAGRNGNGSEWTDWEFDSTERPVHPVGKVIETNYGDLTLPQPLWGFPLGTISRKIQIPVGPDSKTRYIDRTWITRRVPLGIILARLPNGHYHRVGFFEGQYELIRRIEKMQTEVITIV